MEEIALIGIDCATEDKRVGLALALAGEDRCVVQFAGVCASEGEVAAKVAGWLISTPRRALLAFDAPLGWPQAMGQLLAVHRAGEPLPVAANTLFRRETDRFVRERLGKQSLDVGADRIARTAHAALRLLADLRQRTGLPLPMAWNVRDPWRAAAIEVYPAGTLVALGIPARGYKKKDQVAERRAIMARLGDLLALPVDRAAVERNADALDAVVCVLAGWDYVRGLAWEPPDPELARQEGWIWVREASVS